MKPSISVLLALLLVGGFLAAISFETLERAYARSRVALSFARDATAALRIADRCFNVDDGDLYDLLCAERGYEKVLALDPTAPYAWHQLARIQFLRGDFAAALEKINRQLELHGDAIPGAYYVRGLIHGFRREFPEAARDFKTYLSYRPGSWGAHNDLAWIYFQAGEYENAAAQAREGLQRAPENAWLLTSLGVSLFNIGDLSGAREALQEADRRAKELTPANWSRSNPGNDPGIAAAGLRAMQETIARNLSLVN